jgi:DNA (cytosine-5)-methyltransferase 1
MRIKLDNNIISIPVLSFFTGGGFMDMGFMQAGFDVVWTNEIEPTFAEFYRQGITSWKRKQELLSKEQECSISNTNSIKGITSDTIILEAFGNKIPNLFGVIGGPPCQDFSINGNLEGFKGERGSLTDAYLYKILELNPSFFVMENVTGLIRVKKSAKHFLELLGVMSEDYLIDWEILNSLEFGVPQSRERIFVVGLNRKHFDVGSIQIDLRGKWFPFHEKKKYINPHKQYKWPAPNAFGKKDIEKPQNIPLQLCLESCLVSKDKESIISNADEYFNLLGDKRRFSAIQEGETNRPSFKRLHRYKYSPTACYGNNEVHLHPYQHRRLSVREALRIQGVDDSYALTTQNLLSKKFKMIGNGVPVPLAKVVAETLKEFIEKLKQNGLNGR